VDAAVVEVELVIDVVRLRVVVVDEPELLDAELVEVELMRVLVELVSWSGNAKFENTRAVV